MKKIVHNGFLCFLFYLIPLSIYSAGVSVNTSSNIKWPFNTGVAGQTANFTTGTEGDFSSNYVANGSNLKYLATNTTYNVTYTLFQPLSKSVTVTANDYVSFNIRPASGLNFKPTSIAFDCMRFGTDDGLIDVIWKSSDGTLTTIATALKPARNTSGAGTSASYDLSGLTIPASNGDCSLLIYIYNIGNTKTVGLANIVVNGDIQGTLSGIPTHTLTSNVLPMGAGIVTINPYGTKFEEGSQITLTAATRSFGYQFKEWQDAKGNVLSSSSPFSFIMQTDTTINAIYEALPTNNFTVNIEGTKWGTVALSPAPVNGKYENGTVVSMTAVNDSVSTFLYWNDGNTQKTRSVTVDSDKTFSATFSQRSFIVGWDLVTVEPKVSRAADYYSVVSNKGLFSAYNSAGIAVNWLTNTINSTPCAIFWTSPFNAATPSYYQASFSTVGYKNIDIHSMMSANNYSYYPVQKLQYSTDGVNFTDLNICIITVNAWTPLQAKLPTELENQPIVYIRWIADKTSTPVISGNDATAITHIYVYADEITTYDPVKPTLISTVPANNSTGASANGSITLTFDKNVKAGTGNCTLGSDVLTPTFGSKTVTYNYNNLDYNTQYTFTIPAGALTNVDGVACGDTTITFNTMNRPVPTARLFDAVIAKDGTGDYTTVSAAISAAPAGRTEPWLIFVKNGIYTEHVDIPVTKPYIHMIGQERDSVIISDSRLSGAYQDSIVYPVSSGATVVVNPADCYFENITFENKFGYEKLIGPQALALYTCNDRIVLNNCWMRSYQDTYLTSYNRIADRHYLKNCRIEGAVDFIYGGGDVFFDKCTIYCNRPTGGYIVAPSHQVGTAWGYVFNNCTIDGTSSSYITYLGRPWHDAPMASFFNTITKINIYPGGWYDHMSAIPAIFADYNTMDADGNLTDMSARISEYWYVNGTDTIRGTAKNSFTSAEASTYTLKNVLTGNDGWDPTAIVETTEKPANVVNANGKITWDATNYAICYVVLRDNKVIGFSASPTFTDNAYSSSATYFVMGVAESGALSLRSIAINSGTTNNIESQSNNKINAYINGNNLIVNNIDTGSTVSVYSVTGMLLHKQVVCTNSISLPINNTICIVNVLYNDKSTSLKIIK